MIGCRPAILSASSRPATNVVLSLVAGAAVGLAAGVSVGIAERDRLRRLAMLDHLTGLPNRAAWERGAKAVLSAALADGHPVAVAALDVDDFKRINDTHGHAAGDKVLRATAQRLMCSGTRFAARVGGDEFAATLIGPPQAAPPWLNQAATVLQEGISRPVHIGRTIVNLRVSVGAAPVYDLVTIGVACSKADHAMYHAKRTSVSVRICGDPVRQPTNMNTRRPERGGA